MAVNIVEAILVLTEGVNPAPTPLADFVIGAGNVITFWNSRLGTQPTSDQLNAVTQQQVDAYYAAANITSAQSQLADVSSANGRTFQAIMGAASLVTAQVQARVGGTSPKSMLTLATAIFGLTSGQWTNITGNLFAGNPALWQQDQGPNITALSAIYAAVVNSSGSPVFGNKFQQIVVCALYCQDNPTYLINPSFDPTINISGTN